jgi:phosphoserine phosphatase
MSATSELAPLYGDDFDVRNPLALDHKVAQLAQDGPDQLRLEVDLDGTLYLGSLWGHVREALPEDIRNGHETLRAAHAPLLELGLLGPDEAHGWQIEAVRPLVGMPESALLIPDEPGHNVRPGTHELFETCREFGIPITVVSASLAILVRRLLTRENLQAEVVATELEIIQGVVHSWKTDTLTDDLNKVDVRYGVPRPADQRRNALVVGDHVSDTLLGTGALHSISLRANGGVESKRPIDWLVYRNQSFGVGPLASPYPPFDAVMRRNSLFAAERLIRYIATGEHPQRVILPSQRHA